MLALRFMTLFATAAIVHGQTIDSLDPCAKTCYNSVLAKGLPGCAADDLACLCRNPDFGFGIHDCAVGNCPASYVATVVQAASALCATATLPPAAPATTAAPTKPTPAPPAPTTPVSSAAALTSSSPTPAAETSRASQSTVSSVTSTSSTSSTTETGLAGATSGETSTSTTSSTSSASATPLSGEASSSSSSSTLNQLTTPAKIGIGVGAVLGVAALSVLAVYAILRRRQKRRQQQLPQLQQRKPGNASLHSQIKISDPLPGSGRSYAHDPHYQHHENGAGELEMKSHRYEDMLPRQKPRHMV
ncbi:hypothetical protein B0T26DRAFT_2343 [Lasiosphaeria miniovina]|uniref:CFEM domain-containing protein n=1 Tax=Lasiosphaeria miniovina TaxID=1954250 RepID=A0AA40EAN4_9PEZI|nr:uncharacterized protein B0T26DRAFT_2343 [Lasiosphaeria miniovina]KAK0732980.1 hypothetical protein B0T26DRAFT_2343 [Lasiosphaeria miniovina]